MIFPRALNVINPRQRRTVVSMLFGLTAFASIVTVSASNVLSCPAHDRERFADGVAQEGMKGRRAVTVVEKRPRRWIEETRPTQASS